MYCVTMKILLFYLLFIQSIFASPVIVSFTTTSERIALCLPMVRSIINQTESYDRFIMNISTDPYPNSTDQGFYQKELPEQIMEYMEAGLMEIHYVENLGPLKKLAPILEKYFDDKECIIITCDDDIVYPNNWLELLLKKSRNHPDCAISAAMYIHQLSEHYITPFDNAPKVRFNEELRRPIHANFNFNHYLTGYGLLVKPRFFTKRIFDYEKFLKYLPFEDDFFVSAELHNNGIKAHLVDIPHRWFKHIRMNAMYKIWFTKHRDGKIDKALTIMKDRFIIHK